MTSSSKPTGTPQDEIVAVYKGVLEAWNRKNAKGMAAFFAADASVIGFDGSEMNGRGEIEAEMQRIFADHTPARYVSKVREVRFLHPDAALLRAVVGMVPPGASDIKPDMNAVQSMVVVRQLGEWRVALYQNTPAAFQGRPDLSEALSGELRALLPKGKAAASAPAEADAAKSSAAATVESAAAQPATTPSVKAEPVVIYTDGACLGNPGPGGYGVILTESGREKELSGGFRLTTNNRMELLATIKGLEALKVPCEVVLWTDSQYVVNGIEKGWAKSWRAKKWIKSDGKPAVNPDLWGRLLELCEINKVRFQWVRGHNGHVFNERVDRLAFAAASGSELDVDVEYERTARSSLFR